MATAATASVVTKDLEPAAQKFLQQASADQLQQIVSSTTLARHPKLEKVKGSAEEKTEALRKLVTQSVRRQADLRGMVIRQLAQKGLVSAPVKEAKEAKGEAPAKEGKKDKEGGKPKEKKEKKEEKPKAEEK